VKRPSVPVPRTLSAELNCYANSINIYIVFYSTARVLQSADGMTSIAMLSATANKGEY